MSSAHVIVSWLLDEGFRALAQVVSVQVWGTWGPRFESGMPEKKTASSDAVFFSGIPGE